LEGLEVAQSNPDKLTGSGNVGEVQTAAVPRDVASLDQLTTTADAPNEDRAVNKMTFRLARPMLGARLRLVE
jgi:hypothetical protein